MKRTQLYLNDELWKALHIRSKQRRTSISELVREAVRDKYGTSPGARKEVMQAFVGIRKDRRDLRDSTAYIRKLRRGNRLRRIAS